MRFVHGNVAQRRLRRAPDRVFLTGPAAMCRTRFAIFAILGRYECLLIGVDRN